MTFSDERATALSLRARQPLRDAAERRWAFVIMDEPHGEPRRSNGSDRAAL